jgi:hypothetical protein
MTEGTTQPVDARASDDVDLLTADHGRRRVHRRAVAAIAVALVLLAGVAFAAGGDTPDEVAARADEPEAQPTAQDPSTSTTSSTTLPTELTTTTVDPALEAPAITTAGPATTVPRRASAPPTTAPAAPLSEIPVTSTLPPGCRNSHDPACGPFYWDPEPAPNQPLTVSFIDVPSTWDLADGRSVPVSFAWNDPDGWLTYYVFSTDGSPVSRGACDPAYGPWTPPPPAPGQGVQLAGDISFGEPGTYELVLAVGTMGCWFPQRSDVLLTATIEVVDSRTGDPSGAEGGGDAVGVG